MNSRAARAFPAASSLAWAAAKNRTLANADRSSYSAGSGGCSPAEPESHSDRASGRDQAPQSRLHLAEVPQRAHGSELAFLQRGLLDPNWAIGNLQIHICQRFYLTERLAHGTDGNRKRGGHRARLHRTRRFARSVNGLGLRDLGGGLHRGVNDPASDVELFPSIFRGGCFYGEQHSEHDPLNRRPLKASYPAWPAGHPDHPGFGLVTGAPHANPTRPQRRPAARSPAVVPHIPSPQPGFELLAACPARAPQQLICLPTQTLPGGPPPPPHPTDVCSLRR